jgi:hypothetical protein
VLRYIAKRGRYFRCDARAAVGGTGGNDHWYLEQGSEFGKGSHASAEPTQVNGCGKFDNACLQIGKQHDRVARVNRRVAHAGWVLSSVGIV